MTIQEAVANKIIECGTTVFNTVVDTLVAIEVNKRTDIITKGINKLNSLEKDFKKIDGKLDSITYDKDGNKLEVMSQKRYDEIQKSKKSIEDLQKLINIALETNTEESYNKLNGQLGGNKPESTPES